MRRAMSRPSPVEPPVDMPRRAASGSANPGPSSETTSHAPPLARRLTRTANARPSGVCANTFSSRMSVQAARSSSDVPTGTGPGITSTVMRRSWSSARGRQKSARQKSARRAATWPASQATRHLLAGDVWRLNRLEWAAKTSMLKTLAAKHDSTVSKMARKYKTTILTPHGPRRCFEASVERPGRKPQVATFGGIPLRRQQKAVLNDRLPAPVTRPKELISRLQAGRCEWCERKTTVEIHQVWKLADLTQPERPQPAWAQLMAKMRRKTLVVCTACHLAIHAQQPTARSTE